MNAPLKCFQAGPVSDTNEGRLSESLITVLTVASILNVASLASSPHLPGKLPVPCAEGSCVGVKVGLFKALEEEACRNLFDEGQSQTSYKRQKGDIQH